MTYDSNSVNERGGAWGSDAAASYWRAKSCNGAMRWRPVELATMVGAFALYWPVGLAVLGLKLWQVQSGRAGGLLQFGREKAEWLSGAASNLRTPFASAARGFGSHSTGNAAFDGWRASELAKLEQERRKLEDAERDFAAHIDELRRARDREEFGRFMEARRARPNS